MTRVQPGREARHGVLIAGYYRTGTSALSGALAEAGVTVLNNTEANEYNPRGFFEDTALIQLEMDVLGALGSIWSDVRFLPEGWIERPDMSVYLERLCELLEKKFGSASLFAVKHPHICRLAPLYRRAFDAIGVVPSAIRTHRNPYVIAASQKKKNALPRAHALLLWASYMLDAEWNTRGIPRALVLYDALLADSVGTVRGALAELGVMRPDAARGFVTRTLSRSNAVPTSGLYRPLGKLVADVEQALIHGAAPEAWDELRNRVSDLGDFLAEVGETRNRIVPGIGSAMVAQNRRRAALLTSGTHAGHKLRPPERTDEAARTRILVRLDKLPAPRLAVFVVVPEGMAGRRAATLESVRAGWRQPDKLVVLEAGAETERLENTAIMCASDTALGEELRRRMNAERDADYVAVLNAGDTIEPDAVARLALAVSLGAHPPAMIYCDEIVASAEHPWIRTKPAWDLYRLREACFVGDWVWYATEALREIGGMRGEYAGAEEYEVQLRIAESGRSVLRLPEALFVRRPGSRRDSVPLETAIANAIRAIDDHLARSGVAANARSGRFAGTFTLDYAIAETKMVVGISCEGASGAAVHAAAARVLSAMRAGDTLVFLAGELAEGDPLATYLSRVIDEVAPNHGSVLVCRRAAKLGDIVRDLASLIDEGGYIALIDARAKPERGDEFDVIRRVLNAVSEAAVAGLRAYYREGETTRLQGPLLHGAAARIGAGRDAENPGPGAWLAATQKACAVDGPCVVVRKASAEFLARIAGLGTWSEICEAAASQGLTTLWCPALKSEVPAPGSATKDPEVMAAARSGYRPDLHHPALSMIGDPLLLESRLGLVEEGPPDIGNLISGDPESHVVSIVRGLRRRGLTTATWTPEGVDPYSILRAIRAGRRWVRINPNYLWEEVSGFTAVWTRPPATGEHKIVKAAGACTGTSAAIMRTLAGMGARQTRLLLPVLDRALWEHMTFPPHEKLVALWIDEKVRVPWLAEMIDATRERFAWSVVSNTELALPGDVAKLRRPVFEDGWRDLFASLRPVLLVRPTPNVAWLDDHALLMGAAAGCSILAGRESFSERLHATTEVTWLASDRPSIWIETAKSSKGEGTATQARLLGQARSFWLGAEHALGWLDIDPVHGSRTDAVAKVA
jgi:hypothetical protein